ncbi:hypothetical protein EKG37_03735 [Robertmurraya yapensis]|uniref:Uncharacterized protein n=2 Tax=Bacillaceae TaxID=186817 RepID=A0A431WKM1_9BACI|nr:hypothetical protein [Bacillus yapensis]RTR35754.1 hypothetical protein EKG37_03735 [Bacillus yapensis]TKS98556.1 hypothetical protein FAR12_03735 [Bacillus yapensis]
MTISFIVASYIILATIIIFMPKKLSFPEIYFSWIVISFIVLVSDLAIGEIFDFYDLLDKPGPQLIDLMIEITLPAFFGIIFLNFMPIKIKKSIWYCIFIIIFSTSYEQLARYFEYVHYKGWNITYSVIYYAVVCIFLYWHSWFIRKFIR